MRAVAYLRVSTEEQASEGFSLVAQEERCKSFIKSQGWDLVKEPYIDDGYSAKNLERPAIQQLINDLKNNEFDVIVVYRLDRLVRSVLDLHHLLQLFDKHQVAFKSVTEVFDTTTAMGRFFITLVAAMAQWERENLAERVLMGMERRALEGKRNGGNAPYGYRMVYRVY
jgi:site-specific DNA recombinase